MKQYRSLLFISVLMLVALLGLSLSVATTTSAQIGPVTYGTNWQAQFANDTNLPWTGPQVGPTISYPNGLNLNWTGAPTDSNNTPIAGMNADNFSVRFTSSQFLQTGVYQFTLNVDDKAVVSFDGTPVFNQATVPGNYTFQGTIFTATNYTIQIDMVEFTQVSFIQFSWQLVSTLPGSTPGTPGVNPFLTPTPVGPQASVVNVRGLSLRTGPYLGASYISVLRPDIAYNVLARNEDEGGGYTWYLINTGERQGWSSGRYLTLTVDPLTLPLQSTVFDELGNPPDRGVLAIPRAVMNLRRRPSVRAVRIGQVPWGAEVQLLGRTIQGGMNFWYLVRYNGVVGWIYAPFVSVRGNINAVPVY